MNNYGEGYLELIIGPMFSGKTTRLIDIQKKYAVCDISCCVINHLLDKRYDEHLLCTHDKQSTDCFNIIHLADIFSMNILSIYDVLLINEGQFFEDLYCVISDLLQRDHLTIVICGLDGDYKMERFGQILNLIPRANEVEKLYAICKYCRNPASFTHRTTNETVQKVIGDIDKYVPVCRKCYYQHLK